MWYLWEQLHSLVPESELGGIYAFKSGYHATRKDNQNNWPNNYSIKDQEDLGGPSDKAAAIDWTFPDAQAGHYATIDKYSSRLLASGKDPNDNRLDGWREFYGQSDSDTAVEGWDFRYVQAVSSDSSHLWHIHLSCDRDKVDSRANMDKLLEVLRGDDVAITDADVEKFWKYKVGSPSLSLPPTEVQYLLLAGKTAELKLSGVAAPTGIAEENTMAYMLSVVLTKLDDLSTKVDGIVAPNVDSAVATALREGADAIEPE